MPEELDESSTLFFVEEELKVPIYDWQAAAIQPYEQCHRKRVKVSVCAPNGAGKDDRIIAGLALWWVTVHARGRVVITTKDSRQLDDQTYASIRKHQGKFPGWVFNEREVRTPTGGFIILFTTDDAGRAEGWHKEDNIDGPLLIIANEAKSIQEPIFEALDRCTYNGLMYISSPGRMNGRFYESQQPEKGFIRIAAGLADCPHIPKERIHDIIDTYGESHPFTRSTLFGEFMVDDGEARFDRDGLNALVKMVDDYDVLTKRRCEGQPANSVYGQLQENNRAISWHPCPSIEGWVWCSEPPIPGCAYIGFCDPMTGAQSAGGKDRDGHAGGVIRAAYMDDKGVFHETAVVAALHGEPCPRWDNDILAERLHRLVKWYGDPMIIVEANNSGMEVLRLLNQSGATLWRREKRDAVNPGKKLDVVGFMTTSTSKNQWVGALAAFIREKTLDCRYRPAVSQFQTFVLTEDGRGAAQEGCHDDWITGIGLGLFALPSASVYRPAWMLTANVPQVTGNDWAASMGHRPAQHVQRVVGGAMS